MKHLLLTLILLLTTATAIANAPSPKAPAAATVQSGNLRVTLLTPRLIRIEHSPSGHFEDRATFAIQNRSFPTVPHFTASEDSTYLYIATDSLRLRYRKGTDPLTHPASPRNLSVTFRLAADTVTWHPGLHDPLNLKGTCRTLDGADGDARRNDLEQGVISRSGWAVIDDSPATRRADGSRSLALVPDSIAGFDWWAERPDSTALDIYLMAYGHDYKAALADFTTLAGSIPLPPDYVFGYWYSKYSSYSADDYRRIMDDLKTNNIPADVMILDMDWHWNGQPASFSAGRGGWTGWSWNTNLIPDPKGLLAEIHDRGLHAALNLHPADGVCLNESPEFFSDMNRELGGRYRKGDTITWALDFPDFSRSLFSNVIRTHESEGVDFWWLDWQQHLTSDMTPGLGETFWCNHVFFNDMKRNRPDRRPVIFHRWGGLGSHRYQIGFSGDALINFPSLAFQPYFTATASNVGYTYWGHDLGGHAFTDSLTVNDPELLLRWVQFGVFTPIFRTHATNDPRIERRIWHFPNFPLLLDAVRLRYSLFPYIYTAARTAHDNGIGICRPLYYDHPEADEAYTFEDQYMFGPDILVAPVTAPAPDGKTASRRLWLPEGLWWDVSHSRLLQGPCVTDISFSFSEIPYFYRHGAIIPLNPPTVTSVTQRTDTLMLHVVAGASASARLYEDDGDSNDYQSVFATTQLSHSSAPGVETLTIGPRNGSSRGLPSARAWTVVILGIDAPGRVTVNGAPVDPRSFSYDPAARSLTVTTPKLPADASTTLSVSL